MKLPILIPRRNNEVRIADRKFAYEDIKCGSVLRENLIKDDNWFGGRVYSFGKTKEGFLLCVEGELDDKGNQAATTEIIGIYIPTIDGITEEGMKLLEKAGYLKEEKKEIKAPVQKIEEPEEIEELEEKVERDVVKDAETLKKVTDMVNEKLKNRPRRPSHPGGKKPASKK